MDVKADKEYVGVKVIAGDIVGVNVIAGVLDWLIDSVFVTECVTLAARDLVSVIEVSELREVDAEPVGLGVPELDLVTLGFVAVTVELTLGVKVCFD